MTNSRSLRGSRLICSKRSCRTAEEVDQRVAGIKNFIDDIPGRVSEQLDAASTHENPYSVQLRPQLKRQDIVPTKEP